MHSSSIDRHSGTVISRDLPLGDKQVSSKERQSVYPDRSSRGGHSGDEILNGTPQVLGKDQVVTDTSQPAAKVSSSTNEGCSEGSEPEAVNVRQLRSASQFTMAIQVGDRPVAHVDIICTGGEVRVLTRGHSREVETKSGNKPSSWGFSLENLKEAQGKDEELRFILKWLTNSVTPGEGELFIVSPATKSYWLNKEQFVLIDGVLYQNEAVSGDRKLIIPATLRS